jgi:hypothetical protein
MNRKPHLLFFAFTLAVIAFLYALLTVDGEKKNPGLPLFGADSQGSDASKSLKTSRESGTCDSSIQTPHDCSHHHPHDTKASPGGTANPAATMTAGLFGENGVVSLKDIPTGRFRTELEALSPESRDKALRKLSEMKVPVQDLPSLHADINGFIFYACSTLNRNSSVASPPSPPIANVGPLAAAVNVTNPPLLHSRTNSTKVIYLDFNGHTVINTAWNANFNTTSYSCVPFSLDTNFTTFSDVEQTAIVQIWERVAEHFRPFDVDVTTEEPTPFRFSGNNVARALITRSTDSTGKFNPAGATSGGVAYLDVFGKLGFASTFSPAFAYYDQVSSSPANIAEVISHEIGHNMGLTHDGTKRVGNSAGIEYYGGHGSGET